MFFKKKDAQSTPTVKKVSEMINKKSHVQKKYISLMLVPSYSTGKTRSLRIPRVVLHVLVLSVLIIFSIFMGLHLRARHFENERARYRDTLEDTQEYLYAFREDAEQIQQELTDTIAEIYEAYVDERTRADIEIDRADRRHQENLEGIWDLVDDIEDQIIELDRRQQEIISNLGTRRIIPPVARTLAQMEESLAELRETLAMYAPPQPETATTIGLLGTGAQQSAFSEDELIVRLKIAMHDLYVQQQLLESLDSYREIMSPYLLNYPTLQPVAGRVSSGFGARRCPFGSGRWEHHDGVDIPAPHGTQIRAAGGGIVVFEGWQSGFGNVVVIDHGVLGYQTLYAHNSHNLVRQGERVERGQVIARVGSTGRSTAPHLHFEVRRHGILTNPATYLLEQHR